MTIRAKNIQALFLGVFLFLSLAMITSVSRVAVAQADLGAISGVVTDTTGAVLPKASVTVTNEATGAVRTNVTNAKGEFNVSQLNPAIYKVTITAAGFADAVQNITVSVGSQNSVSVKLDVAGGKTEVVVSGGDFAAIQLEAQELSTVIDSTQIMNLPTLDRNPYGLVQFSGSLAADPTATNRGVGFNIAGARSSSVDILLDGAENTDYYALGIGQSIPMDATSEMRLVTSNSGVEYGRGSGAVNVSTKSGTNQLHGSVYEFNRISTLGSAGYNNNALHAADPTVTAKPRYTHNQYGYSFGGPVKKDKIFFFSSTEWTKIRSAQNIVAVVPTSDLIAQTQQRSQDFFTAYGKLATPINGAQFKATDITGNGLWRDSTSASTGRRTYSDLTRIAAAQAGIDLTTIAAAGTAQITTGCSDPRIAATAICTKNLFGTVTYTVPANSGGGDPVDSWVTVNRGDWTINQTTSLYGRYTQESTVYPVGTGSYSPYAGYSTGNSQINHGLLFSLSKALTPSLAAATKLSGQRFNAAQPLGANPAGPTLYINSGSKIGLGSGTINMPGYLPENPGSAIPFGGPQNSIQFGEDISWKKGSHQFTFGGMFLYIKDNRMFGAYENAVDALVSSGSTGALYNLYSGNIGYMQVAIDPKGAYPCVRSNTTAGAFTDVAGCHVTLPVSAPNFTRSNRYHDASLYAGDSYKALPRLILNYGVRWEIYGPQHSQNPALDSNFFMGAGDTIYDQIRNGSLKTRVTAPDGRLWNLNLKQFAPKVGFAWDPFGTGKTSVRAGFGLNYERNFNNVTFNVIQNPPNYAVLSFTSADNGGNPIPLSATNLGTFGTGTGSKALNSAISLRAVNPNIKAAYAENYSLTVEHQLGDTALSVSYVGTRGIHNFSLSNINRSFDGSVYLGDVWKDAANTTMGNRTNLQYGAINYRNADGDSYYHGVTGEVRSSNLLKTGLTVRANYTWSHSLDNTSTTFTDSDNDSGGAVLGYTDPFIPSLDRGSSSFDVRQRATAAIIWAVPFGKSLSGIAKILATGWTLADTFDAQTGNPFIEFDCNSAYAMCPRAAFKTNPAKKRSRNMTDISSDWGPNTYSYMSLPEYSSTNYNTAVGSPSGYSDIPVCTGLRGAGCHFASGIQGRNYFSGPGVWHDNLAIAKDVKIHERFQFQLKGEFMNVLNHANTRLNLAGYNDVSYTSDVLAYKDGNRKSELSLHISF